MRIWRDAILLACTITAAACQVDQPEWCVSTPDVPIRFASTPTRWQTPPQLEQQWTVGGLNEDQEFGRPYAFALEPTSGMIAVADVQFGTITFLTSTGDWVDRLAKPGQGPGEFLLPIGISWVRPGQLAILDAGNSKIVVLGTDGSVASEDLIQPEFIASLLGSGMMWAFLQGSDIIGQPAPKPVDGTVLQRFLILRGRQFGEIVDTLATREVASFQPGPLSPVPVPGEPVPVAAALPDGAVALAGQTPDYRVAILDESGRVTAIICREVDPLPYTPQEIGGMEGTQFPGVEDALQRVRPAANLARIGRLVGGADGSLWVQRDRPSPVRFTDRSIGRAGAQFDVYDSSGTYLGVVNAPEDTRIVAVAGSAVIGLRTGDLDEISVVGFRIAEY